MEQQLLKSLCSCYFAILSPLRWLNSSIPEGDEQDRKRHRLHQQLVEFSEVSPWQAKRSKHWMNHKGSWIFGSMENQEFSAELALRTSGFKSHLWHLQHLAPTRPLCASEWASASPWEGQWHFLTLPFALSHPLRWQIHQLRVCPCTARDSQLGTQSQRRLANTKWILEMVQPFWRSSRVGRELIPTPCHGQIH